jgi:hypothetical protein
MLSLVVAQPAQAGRLSNPPSCSFTGSGVTQSGNNISVPLYLNAGTVPGGTASVVVYFNYTLNDSGQTSGSWNTTLTKPNWIFSSTASLYYGINEVLPIGSEFYSYPYASFQYLGKNGRFINSNNVMCTVS